MRIINTLLNTWFLWLMPFAQAADPAYSYLVMEATTTSSIPATLVVGISDEKPGEIAFGKLVDKVFIGQRLFFRSVDYNSKKIEVITEDVEGPAVDNTTDLTVHGVHKKIFRLEADGKSRVIDINGKKITFKAYTISASLGENKILIEQAAPSNP